MVVRKAANMASGLGVRLLGLVENMSYILCPECGARIDLFGASQAENTAQAIGIPLIGHLPLDPRLSVLCDQGAIEAYHAEEFEGIAERVIELALLRKPGEERKQEVE